MYFTIIEIIQYTEKFRRAAQAQFLMSFFFIQREDFLLFFIIIKISTANVHEIVMLF